MALPRSVFVRRVATVDELADGLLGIPADTEPTDWCVRQKTRRLLGAAAQAEMAMGMT